MCVIIQGLMMMICWFAELAVLLFTWNSEKIISDYSILAKNYWKTVVASFFCRYLFDFFLDYNESEMWIY